MRHAAVACLLLAACADLGLGPLDASLESNVLRQETWVLAESDGATSILTPRAIRREVARAWLQVAREERAKVGEWFGSTIEGKVEVRLVDRFPKGFEADGFSSATRVFVRGNPDGHPRSNDRDLIGHEMVHVHLAKRWKMPRPFWFEEGLATYIEGELLGFGGTGTPLLEGTVGLENLNATELRFADLHTFPPRLAYRLAAFAIDDIVRRHGKGKLLGLARETGSFEEGFAVVIGESVAIVEERWRSGIRAEILKRQR